MVSYVNQITEHKNKRDFVRMKGLEPPSLAALDPKSSASTNFATSAGYPDLKGRQIYNFLDMKA